MSRASIARPPPACGRPRPPPPRPPAASPSLPRPVVGLARPFPDPGGLARPSPARGDAPPTPRRRSRPPLLAGSHPRRGPRRGPGRLGRSWPVQPPWLQLARPFPSRPRSTVSSLARARGDYSLISVLRRALRRATVCLNSDSILCCVVRFVARRSIFVSGCLRCNAACVFTRRSTLDSV